MNKLLFSAIAAALAFSANAASALSVVNPNGTVTLDAADPNFAFQINYNGFIGNPTGVVTGLTSTIFFNFLGTSNAGKNYNFSYTLENTSSLPITGSRASIFGFNVDPNVASATAGGLFPDAVFDPNGGTFNTPNAGPNVELCFKDKNSNNCTGGGSGGVTLGNSAGGTFSLNFASAPAGGLATLSNFYIRYQSIYSPTLGLRDASASGIGTAIPEPGVWALMIAGFGLIGGMVRRRRRQGQAALA